NDDMLLLSKGNVYIKADDDVYMAMKSVTTEIEGDDFKRTSGDVTSHHYGNTTRYVRGAFVQRIVTGADVRHTVGFSSLGRLGGWMAVLGPAGGIPYYGAGIFVWPNVHFFHSVVMARTSAIVEFKNASCVTDKSHSFTASTAWCSLFTAIAEAGISNCSTRCAGNYTAL
ncbi:MAG: hypothetical protein OXU81_14320, partial [Gammaproteobacteria bacterium]|nr:hypothetical protein [Gammaproteobacteria bacterium]